VGSKSQIPSSKSQGNFKTRQKEEKELAARFENWCFEVCSGFGICFLGFPVRPIEDKSRESQAAEEAEENVILCPVCGSLVVQEKCKLVCRSEICRGRVVMNCSEF
jgi:hypothetical protein